MKEQEQSKARSQRQLKFRVWSKYENKMLSDIDLLQTGADKSVVGTTLSLLPRSDDRVIMQFTGLRDKNGVEVYEGDVLSINLQYRNFPGDDLHDDFIVAVVDFHDGAFWFTGGGHTHCLWFHYDAKDREIIGNVHENPELLEKEKVTGHGSV